MSTTGASWAQLRQQARQLESQVGQHFLSLACQRANSSLQTEALFQIYSQYASMTNIPPKPTEDEQKTEAQLNEVLQKVSLTPKPQSLFPSSCLISHHEPHLTQPPSPARRKPHLPHPPPNQRPLPLRPKILPPLPPPLHPHEPPLRPLAPALPNLPRPLPLQPPLLGPLRHLRLPRLEPFRSRIELHARRARPPR